MNGTARRGQDDGPAVKPCVICGEGPLAHLIDGAEGQPLDHKYADRRAPRLLSEVDASPPAPMLLDRLDPTEHTILFGPGQVGKGSLTASWIARLTNAGTPVMILDYEGHDGEWSRRIDGLQGDLTNVIYLSPHKDGWGPLWDPDVIGLVRRFAEVNPGMVLVVDSIVSAVVGDPSDPAIPGRYFGAMQQMGVPNLSLAHVTKLHDDRYPFGSAFWHNFARVTWSLMPKGDERLLTCRKANNYAHPPAVSVDMTWMDGVLREVWEKRASVTLLERILETLADGPATVATIAGMLNDGLPKDEHTSAETIRRTLSRDVARGRASQVVRNGDQWGLREDD